MNREIRRLARRVSKNKLFSTHNKIATRIYAVLKFLLGGRELTEETISRFRLDPVSGAVIQTDKRTSRYHERRLAMMCPTLRSWLNTYLSWLKLLVYRLNSMDRALANKIASVIDVSPECDVHPLLFRFDENDEAVPLGANDLAPIFQDNDIEGNGGRHFIDWLLRDAGLDSADVMGWMGRGNPGQESYGSWSTVIPLESLQKCADAIEKWLGTLSLPAVPKLSPRPLPL